MTVIRAARFSRSPHRIGLVRRIYAWLCLAMLLTGAGAYVSVRIGWSQKVFGDGVVPCVIGYLVWIALAKTVEALRDVPGANLVCLWLLASYTGFFAGGCVVVADPITATSTVSFVMLAALALASPFVCLLCYALLADRVPFTRGLLVISASALAVEAALGWYVDATSTALLATYLVVLLPGAYALHGTRPAALEHDDRAHVEGAVRVFLGYALAPVWALQRLAAGGSSRGD